MSGLQNQIREQAEETGKIDLSYNDHNDRDAATIADELKQQKSKVTHLQLSNNKLEILVWQRLRKLNGKTHTTTASTGRCHRPGRA
jgi:hypothetical protein